MFEGTHFGKLLASDQDEFDSIKEETEQILFLHKNGFDNILVKVPDAKKKIHCWRLKYIEVIEFENRNGGNSTITKRKINFDGEMIFTLWEQFNRCVGEQILDNTPSPSPYLQSWCRASLTNVYQIEQKHNHQNSDVKSFVKVTPLLFPLNQDLYYKLWTARSHPNLPQIDQYERLGLKPIKISEAFHEIDPYVELLRKKIREVLFHEQIKRVLKYFVMDMIRQQQEKNQRYQFIDDRIHRARYY